MGTKSRSKKTRQHETVNKAPIRVSPNWPLLALSIVGMLLTSYLTITSLLGGAVKGCSAGGGCEVVLSSRWATMFGMPTAFWGFLTYAGLAAISFIKRADRHWKYAWSLALLGFAFSVYLTTVALTILNATCPYCLTSLGLMTAILALTTYQRPAELYRFSWPGWLIGRVAVAAVFVFVMHLQYVSLPEVNPIAGPLAEHLTKIGAKFYGASWCEHCQQQKKYFGKFADRLPYIECKPGGPSAPLTTPCFENNIQNFPTWIIKGQRVEAVLTPTTLADLSGFQTPTARVN